MILHTNKLNWQTHNQVLLFSLQSFAPPVMISTTIRTDELVQFTLKNKVWSGPNYLCAPPCHHVTEKEKASITTATFFIFAGHHAYEFRIRNHGPKVILNFSLYEIFGSNKFYFSKIFDCDMWFLYCTIITYIIRDLILNCLIHNDPVLFLIWIYWDLKGARHHLNT